MWSFLAAPIIGCKNSRAIFLVFHGLAISRMFFITVSLMGSRTDRVHSLLWRLAHLHPLPRLPQLPPHHLHQPSSQPRRHLLYLRLTLSEMGLVERLHARKSLKATLTLGQTWSAIEPQNTGGSSMHRSQERIHSILVALVMTRA